MWNVVGGRRKDHLGFITREASHLRNVYSPILLFEIKPPSQEMRRRFFMGHRLGSGF